MPRMRRVLLIISACLALAVAGCGSDSTSSGTTANTGEEPTAKEEAAEAQNDASAETESPASEAPTVTVPNGPPPKKLEVRDLKEGSGAAAKAGDDVTVSYVGVNYKTGKEFDAYWERPEPYTFKLGAGEVIPGWDQGLKGMKAGGRRELIIPPGLAYGASGVKPVIPPNETLVFLVALEAVEPATPSDSADSSTAQPAEETSATAKKKTKPKVTVPKGPPPKKLVIEDLEEGSGPKAKPGDEVTVDYVGVNYGTGKEFGTSWNREPLTFKLGDGLVIEGWEKGIAGMKAGGRRKLIIPPDLGYGNHPTETIPPESTLVFVVDLVSVK